MTKILVIPDVHGRTFWKEPCNNWEGKIIFLGDYHDPYGEYYYEGDEPEEALCGKLYYIYKEGKLVKQYFEEY